MIQSAVLRHGGPRLPRNAGAVFLVKQLKHRHEDEYVSAPVMKWFGVSDYRLGRDFGPPDARQIHHANRYWRRVRYYRIGRVLPILEELIASNWARRRRKQLTLPLGPQLQPPPSNPNPAVPEAYKVENARADHAQKDAGSVAKPLVEVSA